RAEGNSVQRFIWLALIWIGLIGGSCRSTVLSHDEELAASKAVEFAETTFIKKDFEKGYILLADSAKQAINFEQFQQTCQHMHPQSFPTTLRATEFEPLPGQKAMNIFLTGENGGEKFYYRIAMEGTAPTGYQVLGLYRGNGPYPSSNLRQQLRPEQKAAGHAEAVVR